MSNSLLSVYVNSLGAPATAVGMVMSTFTISSILLRLISAPIMDTYNRKYIVIFACGMLSIAFFGFSQSKTVPMLMIFRLVQGAGMAFGNACCLAMVSETLPKDKYNTGIGYYSLAQVMCQMLGPVVGLAMVKAVGYGGTFAINACVMLLAAFFASRLKVTYVKTKELKFNFNNIIAKEAILPASMMLMMGVGSSAVGSFLIIFANGQGVTSNIGLYFTTSALVMLVTRPLIGKLTDKFGVVKILIPALVFNVLSFVIVSFSDSLPMFMLAAAASACGQGACQPALQALSMKAAPIERRGAASSTNYIGMDMGGLIGPLVCGSVAEAFGYVPMWRVMTIPFFISMGITFFFRKRITSIEDDFSAK